MIHLLTGLLQCPVVLEKLAQALLWWDFYPILPDECESLTSVNFCFFPQIPSVIEWAAAAALFSLAVCWKSASHHNVPTSRLHCWGLMGSMVSPSNTVNNDIQPRVTDPPRSSLALSEANLLFLALCEAPRKRPFTLLSEMSWWAHSGVSSVRFRAARVWRFWEISLLLPVRQNWWWKRFIGHQSSRSQLISVWGPAYFLITGFSCFLASCLFAVPFDFITQR